MILWNGDTAPREDTLNIVCVADVDQALAVLAKWPSRAAEPIVIAMAVAEFTLDVAKQIDRLAGTGVACILTPPELSPQETLTWLENEIGGVAHDQPGAPPRMARIRISVSAPPELAEAVANDISAIVTRHGGEVCVKEWTEVFHADDNLLD